MECGSGWSAWAVDPVCLSVSHAHTGFLTQASTHGALQEEDDEPEDDEVDDEIGGEEDEGPLVGSLPVHDLHVDGGGAVEAPQGRSSSSAAADAAVAATAAEAAAAEVAAIAEAAAAAARRGGLSSAGFGARWETGFECQA